MEIHGYWQVINSNLLERKTEKHEIQMLICGGGLKADEKLRTGWAQRPRGFIILQEISRPPHLSIIVFSSWRKMSSGGSPNGYRRTDTVQFIIVDNKWQAERTSFATSLGSPLGRRPDLTAHDIIHDVVLTFYTLRRGNIEVGPYVTSWVAGSSR